MNDDPIRAKVAELTRGCDARQARIAVYNWVRDIPYAYPAARDPLEVLERERGSCSGKHYLLAEALRALGMRVQHMICSHRFNESSIAFPDDMQELLKRNEVVDFHDYLQVWIDRTWVDLDATWEAGLRAYGFPVNEDWDGTSAMPLSVVPETFSVAQANPEKLKEDLLSKLTPRQRSLRKLFLEQLGLWVSECQAEVRQQ